MNQFDERFESAFGKVSFTVNRFILEHMCRITRELDMDLESVHIWGILANLNVLHLMAPGKNFDFRDTTEANHAYEFRPVRLSDMAQITGIPRETIRRKLNQLEESGKVERTADGLWTIKATGVDEHVKAFTKETVIRYLRVAKEIENLLMDAKV
ncbi:DeoR family transcriptional regulator [Undibacterium sp. Di24W]|uniref:DeoR family transcriptional regulator n=1 Tax=Undibacterium sp. Di24W TaxID=3413033 RepID=UPI003BF1CD48